MPTHRDMCALAHTQGRKIAKELRFLFGKPIPSSVCWKIAWCYWFSFPHLCVRWDRPFTCTRISSLKQYYCLALPPNLARALGAALLLMEFSSFLPYSFFLQHTQLRLVCTGRAAATMSLVHAFNNIVQENLIPFNRFIPRRRWLLFVDACSLRV